MDVVWVVSELLFLFVALFCPEQPPLFLGRVSYDRPSSQLVSPLSASVPPFSLRDPRVAATLDAFQVVFVSSASAAAFSLAQLPLALKCLDPALKLLPLHLPLATRAPSCSSPAFSLA
jgi:hypothetical protein